MRPVLGMSAFASYLIWKLVVLPGSSRPAGFEASWKFGLSNTAVNSTFSISGFLKSMPIGLAPAGTLIGPWGYGALDLPNSIQVYSIPSGEISFRIALLSPIV